MEPSDEDANEWLCDEAALESMEVPEPSILLQERRVELVVGLHQLSYQPRAEGPPCMAERDLVAREDIDDENWDEEEMRDVQWRPREIPMFQPQGAAVREIAVALLYNPNRHLEHEDYVSARQSTPPPEDEAGPP